MASEYHYDVLAERSKALRSGRSLARGVGSNPTDVTFKNLIKKINIPNSSPQHPTSTHIITTNYTDQLTARRDVSQYMDAYMQHSTRTPFSTPPPPHRRRPGPPVRIKPCVYTYSNEFFSPTITVCNRRPCPANNQVPDESEYVQKTGRTTRRNGGAHTR